MRSLCYRACGLLFILTLFSGGAVPRAQDIEINVGKKKAKQPAAPVKKKGPRPASTPRLPAEGEGEYEPEEPVRPPRSSAAAREQIEASITSGNEMLSQTPPNYAEAERLYRLAADLDLKDARANLGLGRIFYAQKNYNNAELYYRRAVEGNPNEFAAHHGLALTLEALRRDAEAAQSYAKALALNPDDTAALNNSAATLIRLGKLSSAEEQYKHLATLDGKLAGPRSALGVIYYTKGNTTGARLHWETAAKLGSTALADRAGLLIINGKLREARRLLEEQMRADTRDTSALLMLGDVRRAFGEEVGARSAYTQAAMLLPEYAAVPRPTLEPAPPALGTLFVTSAPNARVRVELGGKTLKEEVVGADGKPVAFNDLQPGRYSAIAERDDYLPLQGAFEIKADETLLFNLIPNELRVSTRTLFADWTRLDGWDAPHGWRVASQKLVAEGAGIALPRALSHVNYADFRVVCDFRMLNEVGLSLALRANGSNNYYLVQLTGPRSSQPLVLRGFAVQDGAARSLGSPVPISTALANLNPEKYYSLVVEVAGTTITVTLTDGQTGEFFYLGRLADPDRVFRSGAAGIVVRGDEVSEIGRFVVYTTPSGEGLGEIAGQITDSRRGEPIYGATVQFTNPVSGVTVASRTDRQGKYKQDLMPHGSYNIRVSAPGFQSQVVRDHVLSNQKIVSLDFGLSTEQAVAEKEPEKEPEKEREKESARKESAPIETSSTATTGGEVPATKFGATPNQVKCNRGSLPSYGRGLLMVTAEPQAIILIEIASGDDAKWCMVPSNLRYGIFGDLRIGSYRIVAVSQGRQLEKQVFVQPNTETQIAFRFQPGK